MKQWSKNHGCCVKCGTTSTKHCGRGLCKLCWNKEAFEKDKEHIRSIKHASYLRNGGADLSKAGRERRWFDGKREAILQRDGGVCKKCGSSVRIVVHHKDRNGRGSENPNNEDSNLETQCRKCHIEEHRTELCSARGFVDNEAWCPSLGIGECLICHKSDRPHNAKGLCTNCSALENQRKRKGRKLSV